MWVLCLRWKEGGGVLNCLHCSALALLLHSAIMWPIQEPRTERKKKKKKKGALRNFSKSETLASERDPGGKKRERGEEEGRWRWREEVVVGGGRLSVWHPRKKTCLGTL